MKFALFYSNTQKLIALRDKGDEALSLAEQLCHESEITVVYNDPKGDVGICCRVSREGTEIVAGKCIGPIRRWLVKIVQRFAKSASAITV